MISLLMMHGVPVFLVDNRDVGGFLPLIRLEFLLVKKADIIMAIYIRRGSAFGVVSQRQRAKCILLSIKGWERVESREIGSEERILVFLFFMV